MITFSQKKIRLVEGELRKKMLLMILTMPFLAEQNLLEVGGKTWF